MKKLIFLFLTNLLFAQGVLIFQNPFEQNTTEENLTHSIIQETNITNEQNTTPPNLNTTTIKEETVVLDDNFVSIKPSLKFAVVIDKKRLFKFIPSIINSINAYFLNKDIKFSFKIFPKDANLSKISKNYQNIIIYSPDKNYIKSLKEFNATFYVPLYNKKDFNNTDLTNIYFGGIDFQEQIKKLSFYIDDRKVVAINENTQISHTLFKYENELNLTVIPFEYPYINYQELNNTSIFFNTTAGKTAQVLSNITAKEIETKLQFTTQIDYNPLLIEITQPQDVQKLLIANSLIKVPLFIEDTNLLLNSDIKYNWLNYATSVLLNKIYNKITDSDEFYMSDFNLYIFNNQINYKTKLYQIINGAFKAIE